MLAKQISSERVARIAARVTALIEAENVGTAKRVLGSLLEYDLTSNDRSRLLQLMAEVHVATSNFAGALALLEHLSVSPPNKIEHLRAYCLALNGNARGAISIVFPQIRIQDILSPLAADNLLCAGIALYRTGHYKWAREMIERAAAMNRLLSRRIKLAHCLIDLGLIEKNLGKHTKALMQFDQASELISNNRLPRTRLTLLQNRGVCLLQLGTLEQARVCFMRAEAIAKDTGNLFILIGIHNNLGHIYRIQENYELAQEFYESALSSAQKEKARRKQCLSLEFLAENAIEEQYFARALDLLSQAYEIAISDSGYGDLVGEILRRRGEANAGLGQTQAATEDLEHATRLCRARGEVREHLLAMRSLSLCAKLPFERVVTQIKDVLFGLRELGDRIEFTKTVYLVLADARFSREEQAWLNTELSTAIHYCRSIRLLSWRNRLEKVSGKRRVIGGAGSPASIEPGQIHTMVSQSPAYNKALQEAVIAARGRGAICIFGESGVGKEVMVQTVHSLSTRAANPMVAINCGALSEHLVESELFGHAKGAFTGSLSTKLGLLESAAGGFVLLDEIGDLPLSAQVKLLRFIDSGEYRRVGETKTRKVDVRVIGATNRSITTLIKQGSFREDLWFRLQAFQVHVPPLRNRKEDIWQLTQMFIGDSLGTSRSKQIAAPLKDWIMAYPWPGNIRELKSLCDYLVASSWGYTTIGMEHLPESVREPRAIFPPTLASRKERLEKDQLRDALVSTDGNILDTAKLLGVGRNTVTRKMQKYRMRRQDYRH